MFSVVVAFLWKIGLFDFKGSDAGAKIIASAFALVGSLIATLVSIIGLFLRQSIERRNVDLKEQEEKRLEIESERNNVLQKEAENRLKVEAAMKAVGLLSTSTGADVPVTQRAGVLFTLATLGQLDLAITLLRPIVADNAIDMNSAVLLINRALESNDELCQQEAAEILDNWPDKLLFDDGTALFPSCVTLAWNPRLNIAARIPIVSALLKLITARPYKEWNKSVLINIFASLYVILKTENADDIKTAVGFCLSKVISEEKYIRVLSTTLDIVDLRAKLSEMDLRKERVPSRFFPITESFEQWLTR